MASELKPFGYAPGSYMNNCKSCSQSFMGDKRAWNCEPCAKALSLQKSTPVAPVSPDATGNADDLPGCPACGHAGRTGNLICDICTPVPVATGERGELVTVRYDYRFSDPLGRGHLWCDKTSWNGQSPSAVRELCDRSQAEELLAAERAEKEIAERANERCLKEISKLRADNAALTARVKEYETGLVDFHREMSALEAKLAEAEKALEHLTLHANSLALADIDRTRGRTGFWKALKEARAALGGKPS